MELKYFRRNANYQCTQAEANEDVLLLQIALLSVCMCVCHVCNLYAGNMRKKNKKHVRNKQKQLCSFLFDASGFSVHTVTAHVTEGGQGVNAT